MSKENFSKQLTVFIHSLKCLELFTLLFFKTDNRHSTCTKRRQEYTIIQPFTPNSQHLCKKSKTFSTSEQQEAEKVFFLQLSLLPTVNECHYHSRQEYSGQYFLYTLPTGLSPVVATHW